MREGGIVIVLKARAKQIGRVGEQTELVDNKPQN